jgi:hypothetical protein
MLSSCFERQLELLPITLGLDFLLAHSGFELQEFELFKAELLPACPIFFQQFKAPKLTQKPVLFFQPFQSLLKLLKKRFEPAGFELLHQGRI